VVPSDQPTMKSEVFKGMKWMRETSRCLDVGGGFLWGGEDVVSPPFSSIECDQEG
jgi:hypothetical protein